MKNFGFLIELLFFLFSHKLWGKFIFSLAIATVLMGIAEYSTL
jgi:hypothetical protein